MSDLELGRAAWERRPRESSASYERFRVFRDLGPSRSLVRAAEVLGIAPKNLRDPSRRWEWSPRAVAWDDHLAMVADAERLDAIRQMHRNHSRAGRVATQLALQALQALNPDGLSAGDAARLLDLGTRLERDGLTAPAAAERDPSTPPMVGDPGGLDPWDRIARELSGA